LDRLGCLEPETRVLLLAGPSAERSPNLAKLQAQLKDSAARQVIIWRSGEPDCASIAAVAEGVAAFAPTCIVAAGGGAVLDAAKFIWASYEHPGLDWSKPAAVPAMRGKARLVLVPTTAGSGSEASRAAVVLNGGAKTAFVSLNWLADIVILDPSLTVSLPAGETMSSAFDALTHAVESAVSNISSAMIRTMAATAIRAILTNLPLVLADPENLAAREAMQNAAYLAGLAQSTASTGAAHAFSHATSALMHTPHAITTGFYLCHTMGWNLTRQPDLYDLLALECGFASGEMLLAAVRALGGVSALPARLSSLLGRPVADSERTAIAAGALRDVCIRTNPCRMNRQDAELLMQSVG
jgi:acetaldehyde dehydrogenase/alcohol dehydrogenase